MSYPTWQEFNEKIFLKADGPLIAPETPSFMGVPHAKVPDDLDGADVVIIGSTYVATNSDNYAGVSRTEWMDAAKRVRQQSIRYPSSYVQDFDIEIFDHLNVVDYGNADLPPDLYGGQNAENILEAQAAVEEKVGHALDFGAIPIVIGQNSPCSSFAIAKPIAERTDGTVGCISLDTHWDMFGDDYLCNDPRVAGGMNWKSRMFELLDNMSPKNLVEIGERGMLENKNSVRAMIDAGAKFISSWEIKTRGINAAVESLSHAYKNTDGLYVHFDMDVIGGAGPTQGDILGELAEPLGLTDYEIIRIAHEIGKRGLSGMSFIAIPPGSEIMYRVIVYIIAYMLAGLAMRKRDLV